MAVAWTLGGRSRNEYFQQQDETGTRRNRLFVFVCATFMNYRHNLRESSDTKENNHGHIAVEWLTEIPNICTSNIVVVRAVVSDTDVGSMNF